MSAWVEGLGNLCIEASAERPEEGRSMFDCLRVPNAT